MTIDPAPTLHATAMDQPAPVAARERIESLDVIRGFAMLGILGPNIVSFAWPTAAMTEPAAMGDTAWNDAGHAITSIFFLGKMMALFAMLFGAGVVVYGAKFDRGPKTPLSAGAGLWYRRIAWLLLFGLAHAVGLWYGDILVWYAMAALMLVWWVRRLRPGLQIGFGIGLHFVSTVLLLALSAWGILGVTTGYAEREQLMGDQTAELIGYTGTYLDAFAVRIRTLVMFWLVLGPLFTPGVTGLMMVGMGLLRTGVLSGQRSTRFYLMLAAMGLLVGIPFTVLLFYGLEIIFPGYGSFIWQSCAQFVGIPISLGYMAALILLLRTQSFNWLLDPLAAVGRMALSNYLLQTILCTTLFYGYGFKRFGAIDYPGLFGVMFAVWGVNIAFSVLWLRFFRFGPAEWLWRTLTYLKPQPMLR